MELSKHSFNEIPDFTLGVLQSRFSAKDLEELYKKYEQRYQLSKLICWYHNIILVVQVTSQSLFWSSLLFTSWWSASLWFIPPLTATRHLTTRRRTAGRLAGRCWCWSCWAGTLTTCIKSTSPYKSPSAWYSPSWPSMSSSGRNSWKRRSGSCI